MTDNASSAPDEPLPGGVEKTAGAFLVMRPGLVLAYASGRALQRLSYTFDYNLYLSDTINNSSSNRLEYRGFFDLSPRVNAIAGLSAIQSESYSALTLAAPGAGALPLLPEAVGTLLQLNADEQLNFDLGVGWRAWEMVGVSYATPILETEGPVTLAPDARVGGEYYFRADAVGVEARGEYTIIRDGVGADGTPIELQRQLVYGGVGRYRHDIGRYFTASAEAGALMVERLEFERSNVYPTVGAVLAYADVVGEAQLSYAHTVTTNALLGQSLVSHEVRLRGAVPLDQRERFLIAASAGYETGRLLDENAELATRLSILLADVAFAWRASQLVLLGVRYQHIDQRSDVRVQTLPVSYVQNTVLFGATLRFPPDPGMPPSYRAPQRVDHADELRGVGDSSNEAVPAPAGPSY